MYPNHLVFIHGSTPNFIPFKFIIEGSQNVQHKITIFPQNVPCVMLTIAMTHFYPMWKLHSGTCKDEMGSLYSRCLNYCYVEIRDIYLWNYKKIDR